LRVRAAAANHEEECEYCDCVPADRMTERGLSSSDSEDESWHSLKPWLKPKILRVEQEYNVIAVTDGPNSLVPSSCPCTSLPI